MGYRKSKKGNYLINGFYITPSELKDFRKLVNSANGKRTRLSDKYFNELNGTYLMEGISKREYVKRLESKGFITEKYSAKLSQFTSKHDFNEKIKELKQVNRPYYSQSKVSKLRHSMELKAHENLNNGGSIVKEKLHNISNAELVGLYIHDDEVVAQIYGSDGSVDDLEERIEETSSRIDRGLSMIKGKKRKKAKRSKRRKR